MRCYRFRGAADDADGAWSSSGISVRVRICSGIFPRTGSLDRSFRPRLKCFPRSRFRLSTHGFFHQLLRFDLISLAMPPEYSPLPLRLRDACISPKRISLTKLKKAVNEAFASIKADQTFSWTWNAYPLYVSRIKRIRNSSRKEQDRGKSRLTRCCQLWCRRNRVQRENPTRSIEIIVRTRAMVRKITVPSDNKVRGSHASGICKGFPVEFDGTRLKCSPARAMDTHTEGWIAMRRRGRGEVRWRCARVHA